MTGGQQALVFVHTSGEGEEGTPGGEFMGADEQDLHSPGGFANFIVGWDLQIHEFPDPLEP